MNILLYCNAFLPKIDGLVMRIKMFLDVVYLYDDINVILVTPNPNSINIYKRFKIIKIPGFFPKIKNSSEYFIFNCNYSYKYYKIVSKICKDNKIDIIHIYHGDGFNFTLESISKKLSIPIVFSYHTNIILYLEHWKVNKFFIKLAKYNIKKFGIINKCDLILNVSKINRDRLIKENILKNKNNKLFPYVVDTNKFYHIKKINQNKKLVILLISRIEREKNIDEVINALDYIENSELRIIGDGNYLPILKKKNQNNEKILFLGKKNNNQLVKFYNEADIFINPSKTESLGFTTLEAMACKTTVIGFNALGTKELIKHLETGFLFNNLSELVNIIKFIKNKINKKIILKIKENAYNFVKQYNPKNNADKLLSYYKIEIDKNIIKKKYKFNFIRILLFTIMFSIFKFLSKIR